jgi:hypothetical protein
MALKWLTVAEMNPISAPLVAQGNAAREALERVPSLAALLPQLQKAHTAVFAIAGPPEDPRVRQLVEREAALDAEHDDVVRGLHGALTALARVSSAGTELLQLRDTLFPEGLAHIQKSYRGQAGHAAIVEARLDDALKARLKAVNLHDKNVLELTLRWLTIAKELGAAEEERARLEPQQSSAAEINSARLGWVRIMNALLANADLVDLDQATDRLLFGPLRAAEHAAGSRGRGKSATQAPAPVPPAPETNPSVS